MVFDLIEEYLGIEMDARMIIVLIMSVFGEIGLYFLFGHWADNGYDPRLRIKVVSYALLPVATFFIINWQANKE